MAFDPSVDDVPVTEADTAEARAKMKKSTRGMLPAAFVLQAVVMLGSGLLVTREASHLTGMDLVIWTTAVALGIIAPLTLVLMRVGSGRSLRQLALSAARHREMVADSRRRTFETRLANALEMAASESQAMNAARKGLGRIVGDERVEVLLADNSHAHLQRVLVSGTDPRGPGCLAESPDQCVAARRGHTVVFEDSDDIDACPMLEDRPYGRCRAACVPVSIMGRTVGVVHHAVALPVEISSGKVRALEIVAGQLGGRLAMMRVMAETQLQASTDGLTGLLNRRAFENQVRSMHNGGATVSIVMIDLDHFKILNDTHGHEAGDRALRIFSTVLQRQLRPADVACRHGGEEFVIALSDCDIETATAICERLRESLVLAYQTGEAPPVTASFGIALWNRHEPLEQTIAHADLALYRAKRDGRNRAAIYEPEGADAS